MAKFVFVADLVPKEDNRLGPDTSPRLTEYPSTWRQVKAVPWQPYAGGPSPVHGV